MTPIQVEIWSDVMCPFCYIGKRQFEKALADFPGRDSVSVEWKSFQLDSSIKTDPTKKAVEMLAAKYGWSLEQARQATSRVAKMAENEGLSFDMDNTKVINSFDAHRFTHLAKKHGRQNEAEEKLFSAHFCEGKSTADHETLVSIGSSIGLPESEVRAALASDAFSNDVRRDIVRARELGVTGVPFFVFNGKLAVSGAQGSEVFLKALSQAALG